MIPNPYFLTLMRYARLYMSLKKTIFAPQASVLDKTNLVTNSLVSPFFPFDLANCSQLFHLRSCLIIWTVRDEKMQWKKKKMVAGIYLKAVSLITTLDTLLKDLNTTLTLTNPRTGTPQYGSPILWPLSITSLTNIRTCCISDEPKSKGRGGEIPQK